MCSFFPTVNYRLIFFCATTLCLSMNKVTIVGSGNWGSVAAKLIASNTVNLSSFHGIKFILLISSTVILILIFLFFARMQHKYCEYLAITCDATTYNELSVTAISNLAYDMIPVRYVCICIYAPQICLINIKNYKRQQVHNCLLKF